MLPVKDDSSSLLVFSIDSSSLLVFSIGTLTNPVTKCKENLQNTNSHIL